MVRFDPKWLTVGVLLLCLDVVWVVWAEPALTWRHDVAPRHLVYEAEGEFAAQPGAPLDASRFGEEHDYRIREQSADVATAELSVRYVEHQTGKILFEETSRVDFDRASRKVLGSEALIAFPHRVEPHDYLVKQFAYLPDGGVVFAYRGSETVKGLPAYRFDFRAENLDWTDSYDYALGDDSRVSAIDYGSVWIDPRTGGLLRHEEGWEARIAGGAHHKVLVDKGQMWFVDDAIVRQVLIARNQARDHTLHQWVIPAGLLILALVAFGLGYRRTAPR